MRLCILERKHTDTTVRRGVRINPLTRQEVSKNKQSIMSLNGYEERDESARGMVRKLADFKVSRQGE